MDVFDLSPGILEAPPEEYLEEELEEPSEEQLEEQPVGPVDIPFKAHGATYALVDEKAEEIVAAENKKLDELIGHFTRGFDPGSFFSLVKSSLSMLKNGVFPGSYNHMLLLLFETFDGIQPVQLELETSLLHRFQRPTIVSRCEESITDETFFAAEIEMLRRLLEPINGEGSKKSVFWLSSRRVEPARACKQLEAAIKVIEVFKSDVCAALKSKHENRTVYTTTPVSLERTIFVSSKQLRLDACKSTLYWDSFNGSELELTHFYRFYKAYISENQPARARASGWLPPSTPGTPRQSAEEAGEGDLASWVALGIDNSVLDLVLKTALWLSLARGLPAVHLFCDVARHFVLREPSEDEVTLEYICFTQYLTQLRVSSEGAQFQPSPLFPPDEKKFPVRNVDYFEDVWRTNYRISAALYENTSLVVKHNVSDFKLARPPSRRRPRPEIQVITKLPPIYGTLATGANPTVVENDPAAEKGRPTEADEVTILPSSPSSPEKSAIHRSMTV